MSVTDGGRILVTPRSLVRRFSAASGDTISIGAQHRPVRSARRRGLFAAFGEIA
jgi:hypothetical protein